MPEVGEDGQRRLRAARVLVIGAGGLGSPAALYLAAAGVGRLGVVDDDRVEISNLQRQVLFDTSAAGRPKVEVAAERLRALDPGIDVVPIERRLDEDNVTEILDGWDVVVDGSDNFPTRYLVNDGCVLAGIPLAWGAVQRFEGQVSVFAVGDGPCYRCLFPEPPSPGSVPSCAEAGVFGVLPGIVGSLQASQTIQLILDRGDPLVGRFLSFDALRCRFRELRLVRDPGCAVCGDRPTIDRPRAIVAACAPTPAAELEVLEETAETSLMPIPPEISVAQLASWLAEDVPIRLLDVREDWEIRRSRIGDDAIHLPLRELPPRVDDVPRDDVVVVYCHHGGRSAAAVQFLRSQGYDRATNLAGGIDAWSREVDPSVPRY